MFKPNDMAMPPPRVCFVALMDEAATKADICKCGHDYAKINDDWRKNNYSMKRIGISLNRIGEETADDFKRKVQSVVDEHNYFHGVNRHLFEPHEINAHLSLTANYLKSIKPVARSDEYREFKQSIICLMEAEMRKLGGTFHEDESDVDMLLANFRTGGDENYSENFSEAWLR